jgi:hypothetical protein
MNWCEANIILYLGARDGVAFSNVQDRPVPPIIVLSKLAVVPQMKDRV